MSSRGSIDALQAAAARRAARPAWHSPAPAEAEPSGDAEPIAAPAEPSADVSDAEPSEASAEPAEPRAESPATAEVEPHTDADTSVLRAEVAGPRVEAPAPEAEPCAEAAFDWHAKPGPAKFAAFMEALPADKYGGPAYVPAYPRKTK